MVLYIKSQYYTSETLVTREQDLTYLLYVLTWWAHSEKKLSQLEQNSLARRRDDWRGAAAVDTQGWVCLIVMKWLLGWRIHYWWPRCSDGAVLMLHQETQPLYCAMFCSGQTDWCVSSWLLVPLQRQRCCRSAGSHLEAVLTWPTPPAAFLQFHTNHSSGNILST